MDENSGAGPLTADTQERLFILQKVSRDFAKGDKYFEIA